jgi:MFS family permease
MAGRVIQGFGATAFESLSLATVGDIFYLHDRGWRTALIVLTLACMASLVSIISGVITENLGYRDLFTILLPFQVAGFLGTVFLLPESQFQREERIVAATHDSDQKNLDPDVEVCHKETAAPSQAKENLCPITGAIFSSLLESERLHTFRRDIWPFAESRSSVDSVYQRRHGGMCYYVGNIRMSMADLKKSLFAATAYIMAQIWSVP